MRLLQRASPGCGPGLRCVQPVPQTSELATIQNGRHSRDSRIRDLPDLSGCRAKTSFHEVGLAYGGKRFAAQAYTRRSKCGTECDALASHGVGAADMALGRIIALAFPTSGFFLHAFDAFAGFGNR